MALRRLKVVNKFFSKCTIFYTSHNSYPNTDIRYTYKSVYVITSGYVMLLCRSS